MGSGKMSHTTTIKMHSDQEILLLGNTVNVNKLKSITVDGLGNIVAFSERTGPYVYIGQAFANLGNLGHGKILMTDFVKAVEPLTDRIRDWEK